MPRGQKFEFSQEQKDYIKNNWGKESVHSMKNKFGCSWDAVCNVAKEFELDMPSAGHVVAGETSIEGAVRETKEELGIDTKERWVCQEKCVSS